MASENKCFNTGKNLISNQWQRFIVSLLYISEYSFYFITVECNQKGGILQGW